MLVVTVGASVEPYVRLTRQSKTRAVSSMNAGVTDAPPLEINRTDDTSTPAPDGAPSAPPMAMKNVGGPAMNEIRSRATRRSAVSASNRRISTERMPAAPGTSTPLSRPEMWAIGAGTRTASTPESPWTRVINDAFQLKPRWVCSTALGMPVEPEVNRTSATSDGLTAPLPSTETGDPPNESASAAGEESTSGPSSKTSAGSIWARAPSTSAAPKVWRSGAATAPNRQHARMSTAAARLFGTCHATAAPFVAPRARKPPAIVATSASASAADRRVSPSTISPPCAEMSRSSVGTSQGPPGRR